MAISFNFPSTRCTLNLDFLKSNRNIDPRITFSRNDASSCASYFDASGTLKIAAPNIPRFDYNPATLAPRGFLIEESRTNVHPYSQDFSTGWTNSNTTDATLTAAAAAGLDGTTSAGSYLCSTTNLASRRLYASSNITVTANTTYTASCYIKSVNNWRWISFSCTGGTAVTTGFSKTFDILNGTVGTQGSANASITSVGNGWYRINVTGSSDSVQYRPKIILLDSDEGAAELAVGVVGAGVLVWGMQLEVGAFPSSYIPTTSTSVTREADYPYINTITPWFNPTEGTIYAEAEVKEVVLNSRLMAMITTATSSSQEIVLNMSRSADGRTGAALNTATNQMVFYPSGTLTYAKLALAYKTNDTQGALNGNVGSVDTSVTLSTVLSRLYLGNEENSNHLNGWLKRLSYYPVRTTATEMSSLTSL